MAKLEGKPLQSRPKTHDFLCCFGDSRKFQSRKSSEAMESGRRRRRSLLSLFRLNLKKSATGKTMPVDFAAAAPEKKDDDFPATPMKSTFTAKPRRRSADELRPVLSEFKPADPDQTLDENDKDPKRSENGPKLISDSPKSSPSSKGSTRRTPKFAGRRTEPVGNTVISQRSQPVEIVKHKLTRQSLSLPTLHPKPATNPTAGDQPSKKLSDPTAGILILTLTLLMILLWGRLCAILCTSLWLYILPRLRSSSESKNNIEDGSRKLKNVETNSDLYSKKKVVYEGFLERNRRSTLVIHSPSVPDVSHDDQVTLFCS